MDSESKIVGETSAKTAGLPDGQSQAKAVESLVKQCGDMKAGQTWCLINSKWLEAWIEYTRCKAFWQYRTDEKSDSAQAAQPPGPISNSSLLLDSKANENGVANGAVNAKNDGSGSVDGKAGQGSGSKKEKNYGVARLKLSVQEIRDYYYVAVPVWKLLVGWYGGGPMIGRSTKLSGVITKSVKVDLHPVHVVLQPCDATTGEPGESKEMIYPRPRESTLHDLLTDIVSATAKASETGKASSEGKAATTPEKTEKQEGEGELEGKKKEAELPVRLWYMEEKVKSFPYEIGERVEACYKDQWYPGDLRGLPVEDPHGRYNVLCDVDKDTPKQPKTMVKVIRRLTPKEGEGSIVRTWKMLSDVELNSELGVLKWARSGVFSLMIEQKKPDGEWIREVLVKDWRDFEQDDKVDCKDTQNKWLPAVVQRVQGEQVYVHYIGYGEKWDEWVNKRSDRLAPSGTKCREKVATYEDDYGYSGSGVRGSVGLRNLGNTCFMNSTLQCMNATPSLVNFFVDGEYTSQLNPSAYKSHGEIARQFGQLVKEMWSPRPHVVTPRNFKHAIGEFAPRFSGYSQQDSQELLACLLEGLHEDLNRVRKKPYDPNPAIGDGSNDEKIAKAAWDKYRAREDSVVIDNIYGQIRSQVLCPECKKVSVKFDPCGILQVPIPSVDTKTQNVTVVRADPKLPRVEYAVKVSKNGSNEELKKALEDLTGINKDTFIVCEIYSKKVYKIFSDHHRISSILDNDVIYAFENPVLSASKSKERKGGSGMCVQVKVQHVEKDYGGPFGTPLALAIPLGENDKVRASVIQNIVLQAASAHFGGGSGKGGENDKKRASKVRVLIKTGWDAQLEDLDPETVLTWSRETEVALSWNSKHDYQVVPVTKHKSLRDGNAEAQAGLTLTGCLQAFTKEEVLTAGNEYRCPTCKRDQRGHKKLDLWRLPNILIIQLKRFQYTRAWRDKIDTYVDYPIEGLDMAPWTKSKDHKKHAVYDLYAVSCHGGGLGGGHYWAHAKNLIDKKWYTLNDSSVRKVGVETVKTKEAYLLFYARRGFDGAKAASAAE